MVPTLLPGVQYLAMWAANIRGSALQAHIGESFIFPAHPSLTLSMYGVTVAMLRVPSRHFSWRTLRNLYPAGVILARVFTDTMLSLCED